MLVANLVIAGYVVSAFGDEEPELTEEEKRIGDNDASGPRDGALSNRLIRDWRGNIQLEWRLEFGYGTSELILF